MKISNKREFQQIAFNHSSDIDFKDFMNLCKKCSTNALQMHLQLLQKKQFKKQWKQLVI